MTSAEFKEIKTQLKMTSEQMLGLVEQPKDTCPMIDEVKGCLSVIHSEISGSCSRPGDDVEALESTISDIESSIFWACQSDELEEIRKNAAKIRAWGLDWKNLALELFKAHGSVDDFPVAVAEKLNCL